jgi:hypothetical protein
MNSQPEIQIDRKLNKDDLIVIAGAGGFKIGRASCRERV